jgi:hypothetical protein
MAMCWRAGSKTGIQVLLTECGHPSKVARRENGMYENRRKQARAIAIAKTQDDQFRKLALIALAVTMTAACAFGLLSLIG